MMISTHGSVPSSSSTAFLQPIQGKKDNRFECTGFILNLVLSSPQRINQSDDTDAERRGSRRRHHPGDLGQSLPPCGLEVNQLLPCGLGLKFTLVTWVKVSLLVGWRLICSPLGTWVKVSLLGGWRIMCLPPVD